MYDVLLVCEGDTSLLVEEGAVLGGDGYDGTYTLRTDAVSDTTLGSGAGWVATTVDCGIKYNFNVSRGEGGVSGVSMACVSGIAQLIIVVISFIGFCVLYPNESDGTVGLGSSKRVIISTIYCQM